ncbi:MAG: hypothetical protein CL973_03355 [Euryarchaeota archaeon]|nr:hypothetical protein [Euryarchaeota archaeon]
MRKGSLGSLNWISRFIDETPGDNQVGGLPRQVPGVCWSRVNPTPTPNPVIRIWSSEMAEELSLEAKENDILGGQKLSSGMHPYAQRYGGHQFGNWAGQLGDGRAITLGEVDTGEEIFELQLKGSGVTPYSRFADGKAVLRSSIREFLCSEAMHHLCVPTTRALSLVTTGEDVVRDILYDGRSAAEPGAIICRVAPSFIRFGSFQIHSMSGDLGTLRSLVDYTVKHHFPDYNIQTDDGIIEWLKRIADETALMIAHWMRIGFVHGVMNTDNMSIHGLTIDYGPYGWLEDFNPDWTPNTTDSGRKRYKFGNQAQIGGWNYARLLESIAPLLEQPNKLHKALDYYYETYQNYNNGMWAEKLGLDEFNTGDDKLISELTALLQSVETDMTIFFRLLSSIKEPEISHLNYAFYSGENIPEQEWNVWLNKWWSRVKQNPDQEKMKLANPKYVLRNWMAQLAIDAAEGGDYSVAIELYELLRNPYLEQPEYEEKWFKKRPEWARYRVGCSMLSCSS